MENIQKLDKTDVQEIHGYTAKNERKHGMLGMVRTVMNGARRSAHWFPPLCAVGY